ncbi:MAG TPA: hypothetical protein VGP63_12655 [Planctomycetaceae bacterium]|jgi:hypothetical protein|nr:hypothetical protein [Planctomycetaceae bacterium]
MTDKPDRKRWSWIAQAVALFLLLMVYGLGTRPTTYLVAKLYGGNHTVTGYLRFVVMPYRPLYWTLN